MESITALFAALPGRILAAPTWALTLGLLIMVAGAALAVVWALTPTDDEAQAAADRAAAALAARIRGDEDDARLAVELHNERATLDALAADLLTDRGVARAARKFATVR
jgi:hypothetical protein